MAGQRQRKAAFRYSAGAMLALALAAPAAAQSGPSCAADPEAAARQYNYILGTQAIGGPYQHTKGNRLIEQAENVRGMGSNLLKISLAQGAAPNYGSADAARSAKTTLDYVKGSPAIQQALDMDFTYYQAWVHSFTDAKWRDGVDMTEARQYYDEMYALTAWLLERYSGTGKVFMLGNWEGDWLLLGRGPRLLRGVGDDARQHGNTVLLEEVPGLVLVKIHAARPIRVRKERVKGCGRSPR